ncbi:MAG: hypothetical protein NDI66_05775 [Pseudomonas sp.]|nr:hypothetical protein [Pseudomonas sp.]
MLLATALMAGGLALAFATIAAASKTATRGEAMAANSERMRAVAGFLRTRIAAARAVPFALDESSGLPQRFIGEPDRLRFVADLPDYLGQGGPYLHDFSVEDAGDGVRVTLALSLVLAGEAFDDDPPRAPELLADGLEDARFRYRALDETGALADWQERWTATDQLPLLVEVTLRDANGREWPPIVIAPRLAVAGGVGVAPAITQ